MVYCSFLDICMGHSLVVMKYVPEHFSDEGKRSVLKTVLLLVLIISIIVTAVSEVIIFIIPNFAWRKSLTIACTGLILFSVNKVLLNYLNAILEMVSYAIFTSLRYGAIAITIFIMAVMRHVSALKFCLHT